MYTYKKLLRTVLIVWILTWGFFAYGTPYDFTPAGRDNHALIGNPEDLFGELDFLELTDAASITERTYPAIRVYPTQSNEYAYFWKCTVIENTDSHQVARPKNNQDCKPFVFEKTKTGYTFYFDEQWSSCEAHEVCQLENLAFIHVASLDLVQHGIEQAIREGRVVLEAGLAPFAILMGGVVQGSLSALLMNGSARMVATAGVRGYISPYTQAFVFASAPTIGSGLKGLATLLNLSFAIGGAVTEEMIGSNLHNLSSTELPMLKEDQSWVPFVPVQGTVEDFSRDLSLVLSDQYRSLSPNYRLKRLRSFKNRSCENCFYFYPEFSNQTIKEATRLRCASERRLKRKKIDAFSATYRCTSGSDCVICKSQK